MGKKDKNKKKGKGAEKTVQKTDKKLAAKHKKMLEKIGETDITEIVAKLEADEAKRTTVQEQLCPPPTPRSNFSICAHPEKEELIVFGGEFFNGQNLTIYNDMYVYTIGKNEWKSIKVPAGPGPRSAHQMVSVANDGGQLWLFGGEHASPSQLQFYHYKDLWVYRLTEKKWEKITASGPSPRSGHRMVAIKKKLFVFGGFYDSGISYKYYNDIWMFSMETYLWTEIKPIGVVRPLPRSAGCMAATSEGKLLVWGGYSKTAVKKEIDRGVTHTDMFALIPDKSDSTGLAWKWTSIKAGGIRPAPRSGVNCAVSSNGRAYIYGGVLDLDEDEENLHGTFSNEFHSLDLTTNVWRLIELSGNASSGKDKKSRRSQKDENSIEMDESTVAEKSTVSSDGVFTVTIGPSSESTSTAGSAAVTVTKQKSTTTNCPSPRMKPGLVVCKGILYLYGGIYEEENKQHTLADFYSLDLHKMDAWKTIIGPVLDGHEWMDSDSEDSSNDDDDSDDIDDEEDDDTDSDDMDTD